MTDRTTGSRKRAVLGREEALWAEIIRCELDSWRPRRLPARFHPGAQRKQAPAWGSLPLVVAACVVVLTVATFANLTSDVSGVLHHLAGIRALPVPGVTTGGTPARGQGHGPARGSGSLASSARTNRAVSGPSPHIARVGTASEPRTTAPSPSAQGPAPLPSPPVPPIPSPTSPAIPPLATPSMSSDPPAGLSAGQPPGMGGPPVPSPG
ncbi:MAG: hypothetical protein M3Z97_03600 [Candidatus Dormibacteraeota bacterium]|nr:hypothetical protein [Candidatus Dormibacteraeota bacterium]